jgi:hypothetical protein
MRPVKGIRSFRSARAFERALRRSGHARYWTSETLEVVRRTEVVGLHCVPPTVCVRPDMVRRGIRRRWARITCRVLGLVGGTGARVGGFRCRVDRVRSAPRARSTGLRTARVDPSGFAADSAAVATTLIRPTVCLQGECMRARTSESGSRRRRRPWPNARSVALLTPAQLFSSPNHESLLCAGRTPWPMPSRRRRFVRVPRCRKPWF